ncbi:MAG: hypothetical protein HN855_08345 [Anaerolineae bacterium]|nr:hypothetical protein [Anaerolineae bacterium]MBT7070987.1 hypothetical protein [Anaerolineae bacterium]MBT7325153.1 hypothetical protein [Anaerolineae bacterium]
MDGTLKTGEWIVHKQYGVGQIMAIEEKIINGKTREYFRVKISGGVYWLPIKKIPDHVRFVSSKYKLSKALRVVSKEPVLLSKNYKIRNKEVAERADGATLQAKGELIRDLHARRHTEGISSSIMDERQLTTLRQQFMREMSVILDIEMEEAEAKLDKALAISIATLEE